jgi:hypothetical protein
MAGPKNASLSAGNFRFYDWPNPENPDEPFRLLSVTSIRKLCGEPFQLVNWQLNNIINVAMGTTQRIRIGPRGGRNKTYVLDGEFPGPFLSRLLATEGKQAGLDSTRAWLRETADRPRDTAAARGTIVHEAIEIGATVATIDRRYVELAVGRLSPRDQKKMKSGITDEDVDFIRGAVANYWDMRLHVPFVLIAREPQVFNLDQGYGGSADGLFWFLPEGADLKDLAHYQKLADKRLVDKRLVDETGGHVTLGDWKTSKGVYTDHVLQVHGYMGAEFVGADGQRDERLTELLIASEEAAIVHIRPDKWSVDFANFRPDAMRAFFGSVAMARFIAAHEKPFDLFTRTLKGNAPESATDTEEDDA